MCFREKLTELLRHSYLSLRILSARSGVPEEMIYAYLIGKKKPTLTYVILLVEVLNVTVEDLFTSEEIRKAPEGDIVKLNGLFKLHSG